MTLEYVSTVEAVVECPEHGHYGLVRYATFSGPADDPEWAQHDIPRCFCGQELVPVEGDRWEPAY